MAKEERVKPKEKGAPAGLLVGGAAVLATLALIFATRGAKAAPPPPPEGYVCPYCGQVFATYEELVAHVQTAHAGARIPLEIVWT